MQLQRSAIVSTALLALLLAAAPPAGAQDERMRVFGSVNAGVGKVDNLPVQGLTKQGTTDYRILALQFRFALSDQDQFVTQLISRRVGASVINEAFSSIYPVWAFYQHRFRNGTVAKIGRTPLPRGIYNEVRYIGTLLPFYRVGESVYAETLENLDGATLSHTWTRGAWGFEATGFAGGFDLHVLLPSNAGKIYLQNLRYEQAVGTQLWITTPVPGVRVGEFAVRMEDNTGYKKPYAMLLHSVDGSWKRGFLKAEFTEMRQNMKDDRARNYYRGWYTVAGVKPTERTTVSVGREGVVRTLDFPAPISPSSVDINANKEWIGGVSYAASANVVFKLEGHAREGYFWDTTVPIVRPPTAPPLSMTVLPPSKGNFAIASIAITF